MWLLNVGIPLTAKAVMSDVRVERVLKDMGLRASQNLTSPESDPDTICVHQHNIYVYN